MYTIIKNATIIDEGKSIEGDILIKDDKIEKIGGIIDTPGKEIDATNQWVIPGIIDDQVHFREPGLTHKADIYSESRAAVAGGVTSFMEMPNTIPNATTVELLEQKYDIAKKNAWCNYSFFMGTTNDNYDEIQKVDYSRVCGLKIFMGSSTGNMLVDNAKTLENIFNNFGHLIATHCEDENTIRKNLEWYTENYGENLLPSYHPKIRNEEACYLSSSYAASLAEKFGTRLHILHISTADELSLFNNNMPLAKKKITSEVCVHHMYFTADDYEILGNKIKCNPAIKSNRHAPLLMAALLDGTLDIIATDHAPHTLEEKNQSYLNAPSGLPLVQHSVNIMLEFIQQGKINKETAFEKMCNSPAICYNLKNRGFLKPGFYADLALIDPNFKWTVSPDNIHYKCNWSPFNGKEFRGKVTKTMVNGQLVFDNESFTSPAHGSRLEFSV